MIIGLLLAPLVGMFETMVPGTLIGMAVAVLGVKTYNQVFQGVRRHIVPSATIVGAIFGVPKSGNRPPSNRASRP